MQPELTSEQLLEIIAFLVNYNFVLTSELLKTKEDDILVAIQKQQIVDDANSGRFIDDRPFEPETRQLLKPSEDIAQVLDGWFEYDFDRRDIINARRLKAKQDGMERR